MAKSTINKRGELIDRKILYNFEERKTFVLKTLDLKQSLMQCVRNEL